MRKLLLLTLLLAGTVVSAYAQGKIDTLYYSKDWKHAPNKAFASFYRLAYYPTDSLAVKQYRDYYISGELQSIGSFICIDAIDDANSIFDGECINYFKNGKQEYVRHYKNGMLNGEFCRYEEDGLIKSTGSFYNGALSGLYTKFLKNGAFVQIEYLEGKPVYDYYVKGDCKGNLTKFRISNNSPIWESPTTAERKVEYKNGTPWQIYFKNGVMIALTSTSVKDYGKWHRLDMVISNSTISPIKFNPAVSISAISTNNQGDISELKVWSSDEYIKKVNRAQIFAAVMMGLSEGMATANAGTTTSRTNTYHSGSAYAHGSGGYAHGHYSGMSSSYTRTYDANAAYQARVLSQQRMADFSDALIKEQEVKKLGYLKANTIHPGESISGYVHVQRVKGKTAQFIINIEGAEYVFDWSFGKRK